MSQISPPGAPQQPPPANPYQPQPAAAVAASPPGAKMAVWALVLGIVGFIGCLPLGVVAIILGIMAATKQGNPNKGSAIAGIVLGALGLVVLPVLVSILLPTLGRAREIAQMSMCAANLKAVGSGMAIYMTAEDDAAPPNLDVLIDIGAIQQGHLKCPSSKAPAGNCYFYFPPAGAALGTTFIMCDLKGNHPRDGRNVLTYGTSVARFRTVAEFQAALRLP